MDKRNIRRLSVIYSLISMLNIKGNKVENYEWDFIRLILLQLIILENNPTKFRSEMLPKID